MNNFTIYPTKGIFPFLIVKNLFILLIALITTTLSFGQTLLYQETFETPANGVNYFTPISEFTDSLDDFFIRTDGSNIATDYEVTGQEGSFYFAAQDLDGEEPFEDIISLYTYPFGVFGRTNLRIKFLLAEDDDGENQDWDLSEHFRVYTSIDGGNEVLVFAVEDQGFEFNSEPRVDTDFNGVGDGTAITDTFNEFMASIPGTGDLLQIRFEFSLNAGDEDIAIDNIRVIGDAPPPCPDADNPVVTTHTLTSCEDGTTQGQTSYDPCCDGIGGFTDIILQYRGSTPVDVEVQLSQPASEVNGFVPFPTQRVQPNDILYVSGAERTNASGGFIGTLKNTINIFVNGAEIDYAPFGDPDNPDALTDGIYTNCSELVLPGDIYGDFQILQVATQTNGRCSQGSVFTNACITQFNSCFATTNGDANAEAACHAEYLACVQFSHDQGDGSNRLSYNLEDGVDDADGGTLSFFSDASYATRIDNTVTRTQGTTNIYVRSTIGDCYGDAMFIITSLTASCPPDVIVEFGDSTAPAATGIMTTTDGCGDVIVSFIDSVENGPGNSQLIRRFWVSTDSIGVYWSCNQKITVLDTAPVVSCPPNVTLECGVDTSSANTGLATGTNGCSILTITQSDSSVAGCGFTETITRTWTATDECGNSSSCDQIITVVDTAPPVVSCPSNRTLECGEDTSSANTGLATGTEGCGTVTITESDSSVAGCGFTETITRTWTATDECGNSSCCDQIITVVDTTPPGITCPVDITVNNDPGICNAVVTYANPVGSDTCGTTTIAQIGGLASGSTFPVGTITNTFEVTDACGDTATCSFTVTVDDNESPVANCVAPFSIELDANGEASITATDIDGGSTDNCGIDSLSVDPSTFTCTNSGTNTVTLTVTDDYGFVSTCTTIVTIEKRPTTLTYTGDLEEQYSDQVDLSAVLVDVDGLLLEGKTISFTIGSQSTSAITDINGIATATLILTQDPNVAYTVETAFIEDECYLATTDSDAFDITQEDAILAYTGQSLQATLNANSSEATVVLSANVQDITVTDFVNDPFEGDIRNAIVKFVNRDSGSDISGWIPVVNLIDPSDPTTGTISYNWLVDIGNSTSESFTVGILVGTLDDNGYYLRDRSVDNTVVTVYVPVGDFITGGGYIIPEESFGVYASTDGLKTNFGYNVKYNKKGKKLKGNMNIIFRRDVGGVIHTYQIKGNAIQSLGVNIADPDAKFGEFITKANLKDITDPLYPISLGGNLKLKVEMTDRGEPGIDDSIGINLTNSSNTLLYSSNWLGISTEEMLLSGGNLVVHSGFSLARTFEVFEVNSWPNPSDTTFNIKLNSTTDEMVDIIVFDITNKVIRKDKFDPKDVYVFGDKLQSGLYFVQISQGSNIEIMRLIKY
ncbi:MAG: HYR domain-containing protein [Psychroserpens sp.]|uniref:HYR domain-containing protein n=1 Tax=Psychroserpens sp. TaxID=2020870 RepID=UPI00300249E1